MKKIFVSESVTSGHPDKVSDNISDAILDAVLEQDENSRVACEVCCNTGIVFIFGEITTNANIDFEKVARDTIRDIGYNSDTLGFDPDKIKVIVSIDKQSQDIAQGVDSAQESSTDDRFNAIGAGDQGMMFGYACNDTENYMPLSHYLAHKMTKRLEFVRKNKIIDYLLPDGKGQISLEYENEKPLRITNVVLSSQHADHISIEKLRRDIKEHVIDYIIPKELIDKDTKIYINPTGRFVIGGPQADSGLTGRKIIVDTYGGYCNHGGGAFSGKDATKVDRSAAYMARYVAKNLVASGACERCKITLAYAIGVAAPVAVDLDTYGTETVSIESIKKAIIEVFDFRPLAIIDSLSLRDPIFRKTTNYGHFGKEDLPWEKLDKVDKLKKLLKI